jgi:hypothetical protein
VTGVQQRGYLREGGGRQEEGRRKDGRKGSLPACLPACPPLCLSGSLCLTCKCGRQPPGPSNTIGTCSARSCSVRGCPSKRHHWHSTRRHWHSTNHDWHINSTSLARCYSIPSTMPSRGSRTMPSRRSRTMPSRGSSTMTSRGSSTIPSRGSMQYTAVRCL